MVRQYKETDKDKRVTITLPPDLYNMLIAEAVNNERSINQEINYLLRRAMAGEDNTTPNEMSGSGGYYDRGAR